MQKKKNSQDRHLTWFCTQPFNYAGLQVSLYFLYFLASPIFSYLIQELPIVPIMLELKGEKKHFCRKLQDRFSSIVFPTVCGANFQEVSVLLPE